MECADVYGLGPWACQYLLIACCRIHWKLCVCMCVFAIMGGGVVPPFESRVSGFDCVDVTYVLSSTSSVDDRCRRGWASQQTRDATCHVCGVYVIGSDCVCVESH